MTPGKATIIQSAVENLSNKSGLKCDWHYAGGVAIIKTMPENHSAVMAIVDRESWKENLVKEINDYDKEKYGDI